MSSEDEEAISQKRWMALLLIALLTAFGIAIGVGVQRSLSVGVVCAMVWTAWVLFKMESPPGALGDE